MLNTLKGLYGDHAEWIYANIEKLEKNINQ